MKLRVPTPRAAPRSYPSKAGGLSLTGTCSPGVKDGLVQLVGHHAVFEIGLVREGEIDFTNAERFEDVGVADVIAGRDVPGRPAERQSPGQDGLPGGYGQDCETVALPARYGRRENPRRLRQPRPCPPRPSGTR